MNKHLVWKLGDFLRSRNLSAYALGKQLEASRRSSGRNVAENLAYRWSRATVPPERLHTDTLEEVLAALESLTGAPVELSEVIAYEEAPETAAPAGPEHARSPETTALLANARVVSWEELTANTGGFTAAEIEADDAYWRDSRQPDLAANRERDEYLGRLWDELDAADRNQP